MHAIILAGGVGSRLRPYTTVLPKPLMPVGDYPILEIILRQLKAAGIVKVTLAVGYLSQIFQAFFQDGQRFGLQIDYSFEAKPLGTAGPLSLLIDQIDGDVLIMNGDVLTTLDYRKLIDAHRTGRADVTIASYPREVKIDFGVLETDGQSELSQYIEKPTYQFLVSMGINVIRKDAVKPYLTPGVKIDIPELFTKIKAAGGKVLCHKQDCYWLDIGRVDDYQIASEIFLARKNEFFPETK